MVRMYVSMMSLTSLKMGYVWSKTRSLSQILGKSGVRYRDHIFSPILINLVRMFASMKSWINLNMCHVGSKTKSLGQILEKPCLHIFTFSV